MLRGVSGGLWVAGDMAAAVGADGVGEAVDILAALSKNGSGR